MRLILSIFILFQTSYTARCQPGIALLASTEYIDDIYYGGGIGYSLRFDAMYYTTAKIEYQTNFNGDYVVSTGFTVTGLEDLFNFASEFDLSYINIKGKTTYALSPSYGISYRRFFLTYTYNIPFRKLEPKINRHWLKFGIVYTFNKKARDAME